MKFGLRVQFLLKTDSGYPRDAEVTLFTVDPAQPKRGGKTVVEILVQFWPVGKNRVDPAQPEFLKKIGLSRINSIF